MSFQEYVFLFAQVETQPGPLPASCGSLLYLADQLKSDNEAVDIVPVKENIAITEYGTWCY